MERQSHKPLGAWQRGGEYGERGGGGGKGGDQQLGQTNPATRQLVSSDSSKT